MFYLKRHLKPKVFRVQYISIKLNINSADFLNFRFKNIKNAACMKSPSEAAFIYTVYILGNCLLFLFFLQFTDVFSDFPQFIQYLIPAAGVTELMVFKYINPAIERVKKDPDYYQKKQWHHQHSEWHSASISDCTPPHNYHSFFRLIKNSVSNIHNIDVYRYA